MSAIIIFITSLFGASDAPAPAGHVYVDSYDAEAIYVPAGWEGPVVALPLNEVVF